MASPAQSPEIPRPTQSPEARRIGPLETITRLGALLVGIAYVAGFVIVTLHHAQYGIGEISLLRARVFSAGILFGLFVVLPLAVSARIHGYFGFSSSTGLTIETNPGDESIGTTIVDIAMYGTCLALALATSVLFDDQEPKHSWWQSLLTVLSLGGLFFVHRFIKGHPRKCALVVMLFMMGAGWGAIVTRGETFFLRSVWFYVCALAAKGLQKLTSDYGKWRGFEWERYIGIFVSLVLFFSTFVYGHAKFQFGGGAAIPIRLYLTSGANIESLTDQAQAFLVEETDTGFYILKSAKDKTSYFLPRALIRALEFNPTDAVNKSVQAKP